MFLLDTNVISEIRKPRPHGALLHWIRPIPVAYLAISAMTIGEIQSGIERVRCNDPAKAVELEAWVAGILGNHAILPIDGPVAQEWARLIHGKSRALMEDAFIAATARVHGLVVATRNVSDFALFDVPTMNPFE